MYSHEHEIRVVQQSASWEKSFVEQIQIPKQHIQIKLHSLKPLDQSPQLFFV